MNELLRVTGRRLLALSLWLACAARDIRSSDLRRCELALAQLNPHVASQMADMLTGNCADSSKLQRGSREALPPVCFAPDGATTGGRRKQKAEVV